MASAYGIIHNYGEPKSSINANLELKAALSKYNNNSELALQALKSEYQKPSTDLVIKALGINQQRYNANLTRIEQTLNQFGIKSDALVRNEDKEYLYNKVNNIINTLNVTGGGDLGKSDVTRKILGSIGEALDEKVIKNLGISKSIRDYQEQGIKAQKEGTFSAVNYEAGLRRAGYYDYMNGGESLKKPLIYTPYNDYKKETREALKDFMSTQKDVIIETPDGVKKTVGNLTKEELEQIIPELLISNENASQMALEGAAMFNYNDSTAVAKRDKIIDDIISPLTESISKIDAKLKNDSESLTPGQKEDLETRKNNLQIQIKNKRETFQNQIGNTASEIGGYIIQNRLVKNLVTAAYRKPSVELTDKFYEETAKANALTGNAYIPNNPNVTVSNTSMPGLSDITSSDLEKRSQEVKNNYKNTVRKTYNNLPTEPSKPGGISLKKQVDNKISEYLEEGYTEEEAKYKALEFVSRKNTDYEMFSELNKARAEQEKNNYVTKKTFEKVVNEGLWENPDIYEAMMEEDNIEITYNGKLIPKDQYFKEVQYEVDGEIKTGVKNKQEFKEFLKSEQGKDFKGRFYSQYLVASLPGIKQNGNISHLGKDKYSYIKRIISSFGEDLDVTDLVQVYRPHDVPFYADIIYATSGTGTYSPPQYQEQDLMTESEVISGLSTPNDDVYIKLNPNAKGTKSYQALKDAIENSKSRGGFDFRDSNFYEDSDLKKIFSYDSYNKKFNDTFNEEAVGVITPKKVSINAPTSTPNQEDNPLFMELRMVTSNIDNIKGNGGTLSWGKDIGSVNVVVNPTNPYEIIVTQSLYDEDDSELASWVVPRSQFAQLAPKLYSQMQIQKQAGDLVFFGKEVFQGDEIMLPQATVNRQKKLATLYQNNPILATASTLQGSKSYIIQNLGEDFYVDNKNTLNFALNHPDKFKVTYDISREAKTVNLSVDVGSGNFVSLGSVPVDRFSDETIEKTKFTPQVYIPLMISIIGNRYKKEAKFSDDVASPHSELKFNVLNYIAQ